MKTNPLQNDYLEVLASKTLHQKAPLPKKTIIQPQQPSIPDTNPDSYQGFIPRGKGASSHLSYFREGFLLAYTAKESKPWGKALLLMPNGLSALFPFGFEVQGWALVRKKGVFEVLAKYKGGRFEGSQFLHDLERGIAMETIYDKGILREVVRCHPTKEKSFIHLLSNRTLAEMVTQDQQISFLMDHFPLLKCPLGYYAGQMDSQVPTGIGLLQAGSDLFLGQFQGGLLHGQGTITLPNGDYYCGQIEEGVPKGLGVFSRKGKLSYMYNDNQVSAREFNQGSPVPSFEESPLSAIFNPIVKFCQKMSQLYPPHSDGSEVQGLSVVDIVVEGEPTERQYSPNSDKSSSRRSSSSSGGRGRRDERVNLEGVGDLLRFERVPAEGKEEKESQKKQQHSLPKKKMLTTDREWQNVMEQLEEKSIGREDGFLIPDGQDIRQAEPKKEELGRGNLGRPLRQNIVRLAGQEKAPKGQQIEQLMTKLTK